MTAEALLFWGLAVATVTLALAVVLSRNIFHSALDLAATLGAVAGLYLVLRAEFVAVVQLLIYVGAVVTLVIFAVMLTGRVQETLRQPQYNRHIGAGALAALIFAGLAIQAIRVTNPVGVPGARLGSVEEIGRGLMTDWVLPFEVVSVLLLAALVGAVVIARKD
mgnify:CR=1 FL=1